ncbi:iron-containing alcohol dehydrogenase [Streptomyces sp. NPDC058642]|uniref:iron-containing alcohol dehydrogenase n=1 Tax=Streptomyces sp. NPDC058642 TaxID=3346572 RepID=UPI0036624032
MSRITARSRPGVDDFALTLSRKSANCCASGLAPMVVLLHRLLPRPLSAWSRFGVPAMTLLAEYKKVNLDGDGSAFTAREGAPEALRALCKDLEVPTLQAHGIDEDEWSGLLPLMAEQALASGSPADNPVVPTVDEIQDLHAQTYARQPASEENPDGHDSQARADGEVTTDD